MSQKSYGTITIVDTNDIARIYVVYAKSATNTDVPSAAASTWTESIANAPGDGDYIWQRTVTEQSGTHDKTYGNPVCVTGPQGGTGATGRGVSSIVTTYCNYGEGTPAASYAEWQNTVPTYDNEKPNYWVKTVITYTTGSPATDTSIYKDNGITDAIYNSAVANSIAQSANENSQGALSQAEEALQTAIQVDTLLGGHFMHGGALSQATPASARVIEQIEESGVDVSTNPNKWHHNVTIGSNGIQLRYNEAVMAQIAANQSGNDTALKFYQPPTVSGSTTTQGALTMELSGSALKFFKPTTGNKAMELNGSGLTIYDSTGTITQAIFGGTQAIISGTINVYDGKIGNDPNSYWYIGNYKDYNQNDSAIIKSIGTASIQLNETNTWRVATNRIHTSWAPSTGTDAYKLHFPRFEDKDSNLKWWDYGLHLPTSYTDKFLYIRNSSNSLSELLDDLDDAGYNYWDYKFWIDGSGNVHAPGFYIGNSSTPIGGGAGTVAEKLMSGAGSSTRPVYVRSDTVDGVNYTGVVAPVSWDVNSSINADSTTNDNNIATIEAIKTYVTGRGYVTSSGVTSVTVAATSPVQSSTATAQTGATVSTTISLADGYGDTKNPYGSKTKNWILAAPSNAAGAPSFRALVAADIPDLSGTYLISHQSIKTLHSKSLVGTGDVTLTASDVGALPSNTTYVSKITTTAGTHTAITNSSGAVSFNVPTKTSHLTNDSSFATTTYVDNAIIALPEPMLFKGSLGTGGTITTLPTASTSNEGYTYKVITAGTYASQAAKVGDTFISDGSAWVLIPSGDEPSGTVTSITLKAGSGVTLDVDNTAITDSGTRTISHADTSSQNSVTASSRRYITAVTLDTYGHVTGLSTGTETVTDTHHIANLVNGSAASGTNATSNKTVTSGNVYLNLIEGVSGSQSVRNSHKLIGGNGLSITSNTDGDITFTSPSAFTGVSFDETTGVISFTKSGGGTATITTNDFVITQATGATGLVGTDANHTPLSVNGPVKFVNGVPETMRPTTSAGQFLKDDGTWGTPIGTTYTAGTGLSLTNGEFNVKLGYTTSGNNRKVQADTSGNLYVVQTDTTYSAGTGLSLSGITFNNTGVLSITTTAGTHSAISSGTGAVSFNVPTKTSHLTNDSGFLTAHQTLYEENIQWGPTSVSKSGSVSPIGMALSSEHSCNRLAFINGAALTFEYSSNGGSTYTNYGYTDANKSAFCTTSYGVPIGRISGNYTTSSRTRITLTAQNGTTGYVYTNPKKLLINISSSGGMQVLIEYRTGTNYQNNGAWNTFGTYTLSGWSGWNDIPLILGTLGGGTTQTGNNWQLRLTFIMTSVNSNYPTTASVNSIRIFGENGWTVTSNMGSTGHLYAYDASQNATFPAKVTANGGFSGNVTGNVTGTATGNITSVQYDSTNTKFTYTKNGSNTDIVTIANLKTYLGLKALAYKDSLTKSDVGLNNVENTALSSWTGSSNITTLGTISTGTWSGTTIAVNKGGTGATSASDARTNLGLGAAATYAVDDATANGALSNGTGLTTERSVYYGLVTVNGSSQTRATGIYAPTSAGTSGYVLKSNGSGAPGWVSAVLTDEKVTQTATSDNQNYEILFSGTSDNTTRTEGARKTNSLTYNPSSKLLTVDNGSIKAKSGNFTCLEVTDLTTQNATITALLDVQGEMHTNSWSNANIATIDGSFYITPTSSSADGDNTPTGTITYSNGNYTKLVITGTFNTSQLSLDTATNVAWPANSYVIVTGDVLIGSEWYPLGTIRGKLESQLAATNASKSISIIPIGAVIIDGEIGNTSLTDGHGLKPQTLEIIRTTASSLSSLRMRKIKVSMTSYGGTNQSPIGIYMTAMGNNKKTFLDIYGGKNDTTTIPSGSGALALPTLRIGNLEGLPTVGTVTPHGWGIYTSNGFFTGTVVAKQGVIGKGETAWTIGSSGEGTGSVSYIYAPTNGPTSKTAEAIGMYVGTDGINNFSTTNQYVRIYGGKIYAQGADISGTITATSGTIGGWNIGTDTNKSLYYGNQTPGATISNLVISKSSATNTNAIAGSGTGLNWYLAAGRNFGVTTEGHLYASGAKISGALIIGNDTIYQKIDNPPSGANPSELGWYEIVNNAYQQTTDTTVVTGKDYYSKDIESNVYTIDEVDEQLEGHQTQIDGLDSSIDVLTDSTNEINNRLNNVENSTSYLQVTNDSVSVVSNNSQAKVELAANGLTLYDQNGNSVATYGTNTIIGNESGFHISINAEEGMKFKNGDNEMASINGNAMSIPKSIILEEMKVGNWIWKKQSNDNLTLIWVG